jgi:hypothetical protein
LLTAAVRTALEFVIAVVDHVPPRSVPIKGPTRKQCHIWSDASYEMEMVTLEDWVPTGNPCRMGYIYRKPGDMLPANTTGATCVLSDDVLKKF